MKIIKAMESDSDRVKTFFERSTLDGPIQLSVRRYGSFFDHYRLQSDDFETFLMVDDKDEIAGIVSLIFHDGFVLGQREVWAYAADLRIAPTRAAVTQWAELFVPALEEACKARNCRYVFSAVHLNDSAVYNALIRPTLGRGRSMPRYHQMNRFRLVFLHGKNPLAPKPLNSIRLSVPTVTDIDQICEYLTEKNQQRPLATRHHPTAFIRRLENWRGFDFDDFRIARDKRGHIIGCASLWDSRIVQSFIPQTYQGFAHTQHQTLRFMSSLGIARSTPDPELPFPTRMLTHLACDSAEVFYSLVEDAFSRLRPKEYLAYCHFRGHWRTLPPQSYFATSLPYGLYMVLSPTMEAPEWPNTNMANLPPEFEAAWL